jgi:1,2-phenylacetyl-CoA epoxidase catalytic subunit
MARHTNNTEPEELTTEMASELTSPLVEFLSHSADDEAARAVILLVRRIAREDRPEIRQLFANDVAERIFAATYACRDAAMAFAA